MSKMIIEFINIKLLRVLVWVNKHKLTTTVYDHYTITRVGSIILHIRVILCLYVMKRG